MFVLLNCAEDIMARITFIMCKSLSMPINFPEIMVSLPLKSEMFLLWNSCDLFECEMMLIIYARTKYIIYCLVGCNNLVYNWYFRKIIEKERYRLLNSTHYHQLWIIKFQELTSQLNIWNFIKHDYICDCRIRVDFFVCSRNLSHVKAPFFNFQMNFLCSR